MKIPQYAVNIILLLLFIAAFALRIANMEASTYPYFKGEYAMHYRYTYMISKMGHLPKIDKKADWSEGYDPSRVQVTGVEFLVGYLCKILDYFSDLGTRKSVKLITALFFSLMIFIIYQISYNIWKCQAGGLLAAFIAASWPPLVAATDGIRYSHIPFAAVIAAFHILLLQNYLKKNSILTAMLTALSALALLAFWETALIYIALVLVYIALKSGVDYSAKLKLMSLHVGVLAAAFVILPYTAASGALTSSPAAVIYTAFVYVLTSKWRTARKYDLILILIGGLILTFLLSPFHTKDFYPVSGWSYVLYRLRYFFGKPIDPLMLPANMRFMWTILHSQPHPYQLLSFFLPLAFFIPPLVGGIREARRTASPPVKTLVVLALVTAFTYATDRRMLVFAAITSAVLMSAAMFSFSKYLKERIGFIALGVMIIITSLVRPQGGLDITYRLGRIVGISPYEESGFTWVSIGNADADLVKFLTARTSTRDPFLCTPELSPLILNFAGRTTMLIPGIDSVKMAKKTVRLLGKFYGPEKDLYDTCRETGAKFVLYSIDMTMDDSRYSPCYLAGKKDVPRESVAFQMHFFPANLTHFHLIYENDNYRVFRVVEKNNPIFLSDHPPVYQHDVFAKNRETPPAFYERIVKVMSLYALAAEAQNRSDYHGAEQLYERCLAEVPHFTRARLGLGASLFETKRLQEAKAVFLSIIQYAPDNPEALYYAAVAMYQLKEKQEARKLLNLLISSTGDKEILRKARGLRKLITEGSNPNRPGDE